MEGPSYKLTKHAEFRLSSRGLKTARLEQVFEFGREVHTRGAVIHVIGRKEVEQAAKLSADIRDIEGWHIVCSRNGALITAYRNRNLRGLRPRRRTRSERYNTNPGRFAHLAA